MTDGQKQRYREDKKHKYHSMSDEERQKYKEYQKNYRKNMNDEQKQGYREARNKCDKYKYYNMTDEQKLKKKVKIIKLLSMIIIDNHRNIFMLLDNHR